MHERLLSPSDNLASLVIDINRLNLETGKLRDKRREEGRLNEADWQALREKHLIKDQKIIDLLLLKNTKDKVSIDYYKYPNEEVHPFSMNGMIIRVGSSFNYFGIRAELTDLRRNGLINDSIEADNFVASLHNLAVVNENSYDYLKRTFRELKKIGSEAEKAWEFGSDFVEETLEQISAKVFTKRLIEQRGELPTYSLRKDTVNIGGRNLDRYTVTFKHKVNVFLYRTLKEDLF